MLTPRTRIDILLKIKVVQRTKTAASAHCLAVQYARTDIRKHSFESSGRLESLTGPGETGSTQGYIQTNAPKKTTT
jgi:hypothetical protein